MSAWYTDPANVADLIEWLSFRQSWNHDATLYLLRHPEEFRAAWDEMQAYVANPRMR